MKTPFWMGWRLILAAGLLAGLAGCGSVTTMPAATMPAATMPAATIPAAETPVEQPPAATGTPILVVTPTSDGEISMAPRHPYQVIAYFPEWETRRSYYVKNLVTSGAAEKITIINYAFGIPRPDRASGDILCAIDNPLAAYGQSYNADRSVDGQADQPGQPLRGHFNQLKKLKALYPHIRVVVSLGGWTGSGYFSDAVRTPEAREKFVRNCLEVWILGNLPERNSAGGPGAGAGVFDGIDLDWEYPVSDGLPDNHTDPSDAANYVLLLQEFRRQFEAIGRPDLLLTMAGPGPGQAANYNLHEAHPYLDLISIMTYDFRGAWHATTGHHTNLCSTDQDPSGRSISADQTVRLYRNTFGVPAEKLVVGAAFYGKAWKEVEDVNHGLFQPGKGVEQGGGNYHNLIEQMQQGYTRYWDEQAQAPFLYSAEERTFWTFDDPQSIGLKAQYVRHFGLGGVMFWEITGDDDAGTLVDTIDQTLADTAPAPNPCQ